MKRYFVILFMIMVSGCSNRPSNIDDSVIKGNEKIFFGIPVLASMEGTTTRLDNTWLVTAKHNKPILTLFSEDVYYHPYCDIALIKQPGNQNVNIGKVNLTQPVTHVGYPIGLPLSFREGDYIGDIFVSDWDKCQMSATTGKIHAGMSGGGVYNQKGELVGINHGYISSDVSWNDNTVDNPAVFVSLYAVKDWLKATTGKDYFSD